jgi:hypothetical protein
MAVIRRWDTGLIGRDSGSSGLHGVSSDAPQCCPERGVRVGTRERCREVAESLVGADVAEARTVEGRHGRRAAVGPDAVQQHGASGRQEVGAPNDRDLIQMRQRMGLRGVWPQGPRHGKKIGGLAT